MSSVELKAYWDGFAETYAQDHEREMATVTRSITASLNLDRFGRREMMRAGPRPFDYCALIVIM